MFIFFTQARTMNTLINSLNIIYINKQNASYFTEWQR